MAHDDNVDGESTHDVRRLLARLPKNMRCAIEAVKLDGQSIAEAAARCGISESGGKVSIHRGLKPALIAPETTTRSRTFWWPRSVRTSNRPRPHFPVDHLP